MQSLLTILGIEIMYALRERLSSVTIAELGIKYYC